MLAKVQENRYSNICGDMYPRLVLFLFLFFSLTSFLEMQLKEIVMAE